MKTHKHKISIYGNYTNEAKRSENTAVNLLSFAEKSSQCSRVLERGFVRKLCTSLTFPAQRAPDIFTFSHEDLL